MVRASTDPSAALLTVAIRDYGAGCEPRRDSSGLGVGLHVMAALARTVEVTSPADGGTEVRLTFDFG